MAILLSWKNSNTTDVTIKIYRSTSPLDTSALPAALVTLPGDARTYTDETATGNVTYYYVVEATNGTTRIFAKSPSIINVKSRGPGPSILQGDEELGLLDNSVTGLPAPLVVYQKAMNDVLAKVTAAHGANGIVAFPVYPTSAELNVFAVNGEIIALINNATTYNATLARTQASFAALEALSDTERTLVVNGFKWRIEPIYQEDIRWLQDQLVHTYAYIGGASAPYSKKFAVLTDLPAALVGAYTATSTSASGFATTFKSGALAGQWARWSGGVMTTDQSDIDFTYSFGNTTTNCQFQLRYVGRE